jgi:hypothetical protein
MERMMPRRGPFSWFITSAVALAVVLLAAGCSSTIDTAATTAPSSSQASGAIPEVLDFTAPRLGGGTVEGADYAGKDTAIWFWAPW